MTIIKCDRCLDEIVDNLHSYVRIALPFTERHLELCAGCTRTLHKAILLWWEEENNEPFSS